MNSVNYKSLRMICEKFFHSKIFHSLFIIFDSNIGVDKLNMIGLHLMIVKKPFI